MESGWFIVIGAVIALIGSVAAPWVKEAVERKNRLADERRRSRADALELLLRAIAEAFKANRRGEATGVEQAEASVAALRLGLLLTKKDAPLDAIIATTISAASEPYAGHVLSAFQSSMTAWYRGDKKPEAALALYVESLRKSGVPINVPE